MKRLITLSVKSARLKFIGCGPECISRGCVSKCCNAPTSELGIKITILPDEVKRVEDRGGVVIDGYLQPREGERVCPFKNSDYLCTLHGTDFKPLGCIVSPFMLTKNNTLTVRNRYKLLPCYSPEEGEPAYRVFKSSLVRIFGPDKALILEELLDNGAVRNIPVSIEEDIYNNLMHRETILK